MPHSPLFLFQELVHQRRARVLVRQMPPLVGLPVRVDVVRGLRDRCGPVHAGAFLRERRIVLDCTRAEFSRIFVHEVAHFIWLRLGNAARRTYEDVVRREIAARARGNFAASGELGWRGELGWSAEWRKNALRAEDIAGRTRRWREYCCESFCDTAAWLFSGVRRHPEFTLGQALRRGRRQWFARNIGKRPLSI